MKLSPQEELLANVVGMMIAALIAVWVNGDARKRGVEAGAARRWSIGVFLVLIVFLPLYLWKRGSLAASAKEPGQAEAPIAGVPCPYCGYTNAGQADYCGKCGRQMRSSTEIHR